MKNKLELLKLKKRHAIIGMSLVMAATVSGCNTNNKNANSNSTSKKEQAVEYDSYIVILNGGQASYMKVEKIYGSYWRFKVGNTFVDFNSTDYFEGVTNQIILIEGPNAKEIAQKMVEDLDYKGPTLTQK